MDTNLLNGPEDDDEERDDADDLPEGTEMDRDGDFPSPGEDVESE